MKKLKVAAPTNADWIFGSIIGLAGVGLLGWAVLMCSRGWPPADDLATLYKTPVLVGSATLIGCGLMSVFWTTMVASIRERRKYESLLLTGDEFEGIVRGTTWEHGQRLLAEVDLRDGSKPVEILSQPLGVDPSEYYPVGSRVTVKGHRHSKDQFVFELDRLPDIDDESSPFVELDDGSLVELAPKWQVNASGTVKLNGTDVFLQFSNVVQTEESSFEVRVHSHPRIRMSTYSDHLRLRDPFWSHRQAGERLLDSDDIDRDEDLTEPDWQDIHLDGAKLEFHSWVDVDNPPEIDTVSMVWLEEGVTTDLVTLPCKKQIPGTAVSDEYSDDSRLENGLIDDWREEEISVYREGPWSDLFMRSWQDPSPAPQSTSARCWSIWRVFISFSIITTVLLSAVACFTCGFVFGYWLQFSGQVEAANQTAQATRGVPVLWYSLLIVLVAGICSGLAGGLAKFLQTMLGFHIRMTRFRHILRTGIIVLIVVLLVPWTNVYAPIKQRIVKNLEPPELPKLEVPGTAEFKVKWHEGHKWTVELKNLTPGKLRATATWNIGSQPLALIINHSEEKNAIIRKNGKSPLTIEFDFDQAAVDRGGTWTVSVAQFKNKSTVSGTIGVEMLPAIDVE